MCCSFLYAIDSLITYLRPLIGGVAMSVAKEGDFIEPENAAVGDILVLTKPLGTQVAVNVNEWILYNGPNWVDKASKVISEEEALRGYDAAMRSMARLNKTGAKLMHTYKAHGATDVTGTQHNTTHSAHNNSHTSRLWIFGPCEQFGVSPKSEGRLCIGGPSDHQGDENHR